MPTEILDVVIDELATDSKPALSNIALISRSCRHRANYHRFSTLKIYVHSTPSDRLENLANLLCWNLWEQKEGITQHIRSVCVMLGRIDCSVPQRSEFRDKIIARVLKTVFKGSQNNSSDQTPRSLTMCTASYCYYPNNGPYHDIDGLSFDTLGSETIAAIHDSRHSQYLATLRLESIWDVPSRLLSSPAIKNLHIDHAHLTLSEIVDHYPLLPSLANLEIQEAPSFVPVFYYGLEDERAAPISKVKYWLRDHRGYEDLNRIGKDATMLEVIVHECKISSGILN